MKKLFPKKKLGETCEFVRGPFGGSLKKNCFKPKGIAVYEQQHAIYNQFNEIRYFIDNNKFEEMKRFELKAGDLIMSCSGTMGKVAIVPEGIVKGIINQALLKLTPLSNLDAEYLKYWMDSNDFQDSLSKVTVGAAIKNVASVKILKQIELPFPNIEIQKQIVALLDQAFTAIDQAKANIEKNIENAKELFQSKLNEIFSHQGEGWEEKKLKEITTKIGSGATPRGGQASYKESGISLIRSMNVHDGGFRKRKLAFIDDEQAKKLDNVTILENDVLLNITGASVARCCVVDKKVLPARVNQHVSIIRLKEGVMNYKFLHYALTTQSNKKLLLGIGEQGATRQAITKVQIENFKIQYPLIIEEQDKLVYSLDNAKLKLLKLEEAYKNKIEGLEELKKSILQKAFAGELTNKMAEV